MTAARKRLGKGLSEMFSAPVAVPVETQSVAASPQTAPDAEPTPQATPSAQDSQSTAKAEANEAKENSSGGDRPKHDIRMLEINRIVPNQHQPRQAFDDSSIQALADSIRQHGVMQPIIVRPVSRGTNQSDVPAESSQYELVAGERRWRAAQVAELERIPAVIRELSDQDSAEWALIENLQREDLNPIDRAEAFQHLVETFSLTKEQVADRVGLDRSTVSNLIRLLGLSESVRGLVREGHLSMGQARAIASLSSHEAQEAVADRVIRQALSVRKTEALVKEMAANTQDALLTESESETRKPKSNHHLQDLEKQISEQIGTRVAIRTGRKKGTGKLTLEFYSIDQFDELLTRLGVTTQ